MYNFLEQLLNKEFQTQLTKTTFKWCKDYRYDNHIDNLNCIIETHGIQHYEEFSGNWKMSLQEIQDNDFDKEWLARENKVKDYIIINCRYSKLEWIKNSIMNSKLPRLLDFKEDDIDWLKCHEAGCSNLVKVICDLWKSGIKNIKEIKYKMDISVQTIRKYLKQGAELGWCDYDPKIESKNNLFLMTEKTCKSVICITTGEIFKSIAEASKIYNIPKTRIGYCCRHKTNHAKLQDGTEMVWMFYEEYLKSNE